MKPRPEIGVSACLLGRAVRYDGGHKHRSVCTGHLSRHLDLRPICPEADAGLGVPRPPMQVRRTGGELRLVTLDGREDHSERLQQWMDDIMPVTEALSGFVLKSRSPSCGLQTDWFDGAGMPLSARGAGLFAARLARHLPLAPRIDEEQILNADQRDAFIEQVYFMNDWQATTAESITWDKLTSFHARHKYQLQAHSESHMRRLGQMLANRETGLASLAATYIQLAMQTIRSPVSRGNHQNVLLHLAGFFRGRLSAAEHQRLHESIAAFARGIPPLSTPLQQLRLLQARERIDYLEKQSYLLSPWIDTADAAAAASHTADERQA